MTLSPDEKYKKHSKQITRIIETVCQSNKLEMDTLLTRAFTQLCSAAFTAGYVEGLNEVKTTTKTSDKAFDKRETLCA